MELKDVTMAALNGKFIINKRPSASADAYVDEAAGPVVIGIKDDKAYSIKLTEEQINDVTKGKLIATVDEANKKIGWIQNHNEDYSYDVYDGPEYSEYIGDDAGYPLIQALDLFFRGLDITTYDPYILGYQEVLDSLVDKDGNSSTTTTTSSTTVKPTTTTTTTSTTAKQG